MFKFLKRAALITVVALGAGAVVPADVAAQSDILLRLRSGSPASDRFRVDSAGGVVALGQLGIGIIPASGDGTRMMWYPFKAAFRAGSAGDGGSTAWNDSNIGFYTLAGGLANVVTGLAAVSFGQDNTVSGENGVGIGEDTECLTRFCVAIGDGSIANGHHSVAIGFRASTNSHSGSFVLADSSAVAYTSASAANQFTGRFAGGYRFFTNSAQNLGVAFAANATTPSALSDRNAKTGFRDLDNEDILRRIRAVPVSTWSYKADPTGTVHIGPMAQDFQKAFQLSEEDKLINMGDLDGVNLAGVRALEARTRKMQAEIAARDKTIKDLEARLARVEALLSRK